MVHGRGETSGKKNQFISLGDSFYHHSQERFVFPDGKLSHSIDQSIKLQPQDDFTFNGQVDFFDSRGCTFKDLEISAELKDNNTLHILMTVPRYQYVTITTSRNIPRYRPRYCNAPYPQRGRYICGSDREIIRVKSECRLLDLVKIPVKLLRF